MRRRVMTPIAPSHTTPASMLVSAAKCALTLTDRLTYAILASAEQVAVRAGADALLQQLDVAMAQDEDDIQR